MKWLLVGMALLLSACGDSIGSGEPSASASARPEVSPTDAKNYVLQYGVVTVFCDGPNRVYVYNSQGLVVLKGDCA